jgi:hypothetical protein
MIMQDFKNIVTSHNKPTATEVILGSMIVIGVIASCIGLYFLGCAA